MIQRKHPFANFFKLLKVLATAWLVLVATTGLTYEQLAKEPIGQSSQLLQDIPNLGSVEQNFLSPIEKQQAVQKIKSILYESKKLVHHVETYSYISGIIEKVNQKLPVGKKVLLMIIDNDNINAFATYGNIIGINTGLILSAESEDELAAVIAHELAHLQLNHIERKLFEESQQPNSIILLASLVALMATGNDVNQAIAGIYATTAKTIEDSLTYSRLLEREADNYSFNLLVEAGYNPMAGYTFFEKLQKSGTESVSEYLSTHPFAERRMTDILNNKDAQQLGQKTSDIAKYELKLIQQDLKHHLQKNRGSLDLTDNRLSIEPKEKKYPKLGTSYYLYSQLILKNNFGREKWDQLIKLYPNNLALSIRYNQWLAKTDIIAALNNLLELSWKLPDSYIVLDQLLLITSSDYKNLHSLIYAKKLLVMGQIESGCRIVTKMDLIEAEILLNKNLVKSNQEIIKLKNFCNTSFETTVQE